MKVNNYYLKLLNLFKLFQVWNQPYSIFQSFQELYLECYHFSQIPKENIQLIKGEKKQNDENITLRIKLCFLELQQFSVQLYNPCESGKNKLQTLLSSTSMFYLIHYLKGLEFSEINFRQTSPAGWAEWRGKQKPPGQKTSKSQHTSSGVRKVSFCRGFRYLSIRQFKS